VNKPTPTNQRNVAMSRKNNVVYDDGPTPRDQALNIRLELLYRQYDQKCWVTFTLLLVLYLGLGSLGQSIVLWGAMRKVKCVCEVAIHSSSASTRIRNQAVLTGCVCVSVRVLDR
jgi:hypothetical protein